MQRKWHHSWHWNRNMTSCLTLPLQSPHHTLQGEMCLGHKLWHFKQVHELWGQWSSDKTWPWDRGVQGLNPAGFFSAGNWTHMCLTTPGCKNWYLWWYESMSHGCTTGHVYKKPTCIIMMGGNNLKRAFEWTIVYKGCYIKLFKCGTLLLLWVPKECTHST